MAPRGSGRAKVWAMGIYMSFLLIIKAFSSCLKGHLLLSCNLLGMWFVGSCEIAGRGDLVTLGLLLFLLLCPFNCVNQEGGKLVDSSHLGIAFGIYRCGGLAALSLLLVFNR